jgi:DNA-binding NarL/FixJ family response regulator
VTRFSRPHVRRPRALSRRRVLEAALVSAILLDMSMPDMSGVEVLRAMRVPGGGNPPSLPILMFCADDDQATRDELIRLGATGFVSKNTPGGLLRTVAAYVRPTNPPRASTC